MLVCITLSLYIQPFLACPSGRRIHTLILLKTRSSDAVDIIEALPKVDIIRIFCFCLLFPYVLARHAIATSRKAVQILSLSFLVLPTPDQSYCSNRSFLTVRLSIPHHYYISHHQHMSTHTQTCSFPLPTQLFHRQAFLSTTCISPPLSTVLTSKSKL